MSVNASLGRRVSFGFLKALTHQHLDAWEIGVGFQKPGCLFQAFVLVECCFGELHKFAILLRESYPVSTLRGQMIRGFIGADRATHPHLDP
jgi:hypothetical protein